MNRAGWGRDPAGGSWNPVAHQDGRGDWRRRGLRIEWMRRAGSKGGDDKGPRGRSAQSLAVCYRGE